MVFYFDGAIVSLSFAAYFGFNEKKKHGLSKCVESREKENFLVGLPVDCQNTTLCFVFCVIFSEIRSTEKRNMIEVKLYSDCNWIFGLDSTCRISFRVMVIARMEWERFQRMLDATEI